MFAVVGTVRSAYEAPPPTGSALPDDAPQQQGGRSPWFAADAARNAPVDQPANSLQLRLRSLSVFEGPTTEQLTRLRAELPQGWASDIAAEVAADLVAPLAEHARLRPVLSKMLNDLSEQLSLQAAAKIVSLAPKSFSKFFPRETGFYFCSWDREIRIRIATYLLHASDNNIDYIGRAVGYSDQTTFGRAFKKCHGIAATVYRRSHSFATNATLRVPARSLRVRGIGRKVR